MTSDVNFPALPAVKLLFVQPVRCYAVATHVKFPALSSGCRSWSLVLVVRSSFFEVFGCNFLFCLLYFVDQR